MENKENIAIIFFDGNCKLCNSSVNFILERDIAAYFKFTPLTSKFSKDFFTDKKMNPSTINTIVLYENGLLFLKSDAILNIFKKLKSPLKHLYYLKYIPKKLRDFIYIIIANNRYSWFGKKDVCLIPTPENLNRFL